MRPRMRIGGALLLAVALAGCATSTPSDEDNETEQMVTLDGRPPMEDVLDRYESMERDMIGALAGELPGLLWQADDDEVGLTRSGCVEDVGSDRAEGVSLVGLWAQGTLDPASWPRAVEVVQGVGEQYGFDQVTTVVDRPDDLEIVGEDAFGGQYRFGMAVNTILSVSTGCHEWDAVPGEDYERPSPLGG